MTMVSPHCRPLLAVRRLPPSWRANATLGCMTDAGARAHHLGLLLPAFAMVSVAWLVFWRTQQFPVVCALAFPCPDPNARIPPALIFGGLMFVPLVLLVLGSYTRRPAVWLSNVSYVALAGLTVLGYGAILFAGGFTADL